MSNIIPIQITLQAASAADARQLVQDLAGTMTANPTLHVPAQTVVAAEPTPVYQQTAVVQPQMNYAAPAQTMPQVQAQPPVQQPAYPAAVPTAAPMQQAPVQQPAAVPTTAAQAYDIQQLAVAATALMEAGHNVTEILAQFGVQALTQLPKERYGDFATYIRGLGARI